MELNLKAPVFTTQQTDSIFILTSHLKGYERRDINIEINEDGSRITISGKQVEMMRGGFRKTFKIPEGVILDKVKARFDHDESTLTIRMPKSVKGLTEFGIQEVEDVQKVVTSKQEIAGSEYEQNKNESENKDSDKIEEAKPHERSSSSNSISSSGSIITTPIIAGSALFMSLIVVVFSLIRSKNEANQKRN